MRLACPNCDARYEVPDDAIPMGGRDVQCSNCGNAWFQQRVDEGYEAEEAESFFGAASLTAAIDRVEAGPTAPAPAAGHGTEGQGETASAAPPRVMGPKAAAIEESLLAVLREEADREAEARRLEAQRAEVQRAAQRRAEAEAQLEVQPDLGLDAIGLGVDPSKSPAPLQAAQSAASSFDHEAAGSSAPVASPVLAAPQRPFARRDLLPDVEEINSTLQPGEMGAANSEEQSVAQDQKGRATFRLGFLIGMGLMLLAAAIYIAAPLLARQVPSLAPTLESYVALIDGLRQTWSHLLERAADALGGPKA